MKSRNRPPQSTLGSLAPLMGMGIQLAATMVLAGGIGWWLDERCGTRPWLLAVGVVIGATGGMINVIRTSLAASPRRGKRTAGKDDPTS